MNKNLYMETMNKISMNENCTERIIKEAESVNTSQYKPKRKIRFIPVMAAVAADPLHAVHGRRLKAADLNGLELSFSETSTDMEITDVETSLIGEMENFSYESSRQRYKFYSRWNDC